MPARLTVVTGPPGADVGPVCSLLGVRLGDGLAVRVIDTTPYGPRGDLDTRHRSLDPFHLAPAAADGYVSCGSVMLEALPAAWQDPDTNLGVVWTGTPTMDVANDLHTLDALGLSPAHRTTVQWADPYPVTSSGITPPPVERGDVGAQARDSVLRGGGQVLVEAGDGMTAMRALTALHLPPWASWVHQLNLWVVTDLRHAADLGEAARQVETAVQQLTGGAPRYRGDGGGRERLRIAVYGLPNLVPSLAGQRAPVGDLPGYAKLTGFDDEVTARTGGMLALVHTGLSAQDHRWLDLRNPEVG